MMDNKSKHISFEYQTDAQKENKSKEMNIL
jgi:hypothetical protein